MAGEVVSNDFVLAGFTEKEATVLKAKVEEDMIVVEDLVEDEVG